MSRCKDAPIGFECPYRHNCPHLEGMSTTWAMEVYQEAFELRSQLHAMEQRYELRIAELEKTLLERDEKIAQLQLDHRKKFKAKVKTAAVHGKTPGAERRRGIRAGIGASRTTLIGSSMSPPRQPVRTARTGHCSPARSCTSMSRKTLC